jgi:hypothetical protein
VECHGVKAATSAQHTAVSTTTVVAIQQSCRPIILQLVSTLLAQRLLSNGGSLSTMLTTDSCNLLLLAWPVDVNSLLISSLPVGFFILFDCGWSKVGLSASEQVSTTVSTYNRPFCTEENRRKYPEVVGKKRFHRLFHYTDILLDTVHIGIWSYPLEPDTLLSSFSQSCLARPS